MKKRTPAYNSRGDNVKENVTGSFVASPLRMTAE